MRSKDPKSRLSTVLAELKNEYLEKFPQKLLTLKKFTVEQNWKELEEEYHKLKGTGKTYGFPEISIVCQCLEDLAHDPRTRDGETFEKALTLLEKMYQCYLKKEPVDLQEDSFARSLLAPKFK